MVFIGGYVRVSMATKTPFFPGMSRLLFGRPPSSLAPGKARRRHRLGALCSAQLAELFGGFLPAALSSAKAARGPNSRRRVFSLEVTFWAFLGQVLDPDSSCRKAVAGVQSLFAAQRSAMPSCGAAAYCRARRRLPVRFLQRINDHVVGRLCAGSAGGRTLVVDGTTVTMPDTDANAAKYPQHNVHKPGRGFPIMKLAGLFCLDSGAWVATAKSHFRVHESRLLGRLYRHLRAGDTLVADRAYCSYFTFAELAARGVHLVVRIHHMRKVDFRKGARLGKGDHVVRWGKPPRPKWMDSSTYAAVPPYIEVRETRLAVGEKGYRTKRITTGHQLHRPGREERGGGRDLLPETVARGALLRRHQDGDVDGRAALPQPRDGVPRAGRTHGRLQPDPLAGGAQRRGSRTRELQGHRRPRGCLVGPDMGGADEVEGGRNGGLAARDHRG